MHTDTLFEFNLSIDLLKLGIIYKKNKKETMHFESGTISENNNFTYVCAQIIQNDYLNQSNTFVSSFVQDWDKCLKENKTRVR